jgi:16S rRNA (guanine(966)-N(2))-methyltransferase RsmD
LSGHSTQSGKSTYRPTTDRAKETLYNILNNLIDFDSVKCLDLFAGSWALGFEALSRGAAYCDFVDTSSSHLSQIKRTAEELNVVDCINLFDTDVLDFLEDNSNAYYDLIFADPPYNYSFYDSLQYKIFSLRFAVFVLEHSSAVSLLYDTNKFDVISRRIGITNFKIFSSKE